MSGQWALNGRAGLVDGHSANEPSHSDDRQPLPALPVEVLMNVLHHLSPTGSLTSYDSTAMRPDVSDDFLQWRVSLANFILASRLFYQVGTPFLYRMVLLSDQEEVLHFFRTITKLSDRRRIVRSLAWVTVLSTDDINIYSTMLRQSKLDSTSVEFWDSIKEEWPRQSIDSHVAEIMNIVDSTSLQAWRLLGAILGLCPYIKMLFMLHSSGRIHVPPSWPPGYPYPNPPSRELDALMPLLWHRTRPSTHRFLAELETLTIEAHEDPPSHINAQFIISLMMMNSPMLSRIEIKGPLLLQEMWDGFQHYPERKILAGNVKELVLLRGIHPQDEMLATVMLFPRLISLQAEYDDPSIRPGDMPTPGFTITPALLRLADTLEVLSLTTAPATRNHWYHVDDYPHCLTSLDQIHRLKDFTTESMWIFGRIDTSIALQLPDLLPSSLVRFQLIDYWGTRAMTTSESADFYPRFPNQWTAAEFYYHVLMAMGNEVSSRFPDLREITLVSKHLCEEASMCNGGGGQGQSHATTGSRASMLRLYEFFSDLGIEFKLEMPVKSTAASQADWAKIN